MKQSEMNRKPMYLRVIPVRTVNLPTGCLPTEIGSAFPSGLPVREPHALEHPQGVSITTGTVIQPVEPLNDSSLVI